MRRKVVPLLLLTGLTISIGLMGGGAQAAFPQPRVDYRFENSFKSSVHRREAPVLRRIGDDGLFNFAGGADGYLEWVEGAGLRMRNAGYAVGSVTNYTIAMKVMLDDISSYRKLVDPHNRKTSDGWYELDGYIAAYPVAEPAVDPEPIQEDSVHTLVFTRAHGNVKAYVDGVRILEYPDPGGDLVVGPDPANKVLAFFIDDGSGSEETGGRVYRLRIWKDPLTNNQAESL
jgi:hypothetical protein